MAKDNGELLKHKKAPAGAFSRGEPLVDCAAGHQNLSGDNHHQQANHHRHGGTFDHFERRNFAIPATATTTPETGDIVRPRLEACSIGIDR